MAKRKNRLPNYQKQSLVENFQPKTEKQEELLDLIYDREIIICKGPSGSGKTFVALAAALDLLGDTYKQVILIKSMTVVPEEELGFLKGDLRAKLDPYMMSFTWNVDKICGQGSADSLLDKEIINILPIAFARGISIDNSIVIIDEVQNLSFHTFKTLVTRIGTNSKYIFLGDVEQIDRKNKTDSPLEKIFSIFKDDDIVGTIEFTDEDCVRNKIIPKILTKLRENGI